MNCYSVVAAFGAKKVAFSLHSDKFKQEANVIYSLGLFCLISIRHSYFYIHPPDSKPFCKRAQSPECASAQVPECPSARVHKSRPASSGLCASDSV